MSKMSPTKQARLREMLNERGWNCCYCGRECVVNGDMQNPAHATKEHLTPKSRGGKEVTVACVTCNGVKGDMTEKEYRFFLATRTLPDTYIEWLTRVKIRCLEDQGVTQNGIVRLHQNGNTAPL